MTEARRAKHPRHARLIDKIGAGDQFEEFLTAIRRAQFECDRPLIGVVGAELQAAEIRPIALDDRQRRSSWRSCSRLDKDHIGTQLGEQPGPHLTTVIGEIQHAHPVEQIPHNTIPLGRLQPA